MDQLQAVLVVNLLFVAGSPNGVGVTPPYLPVCELLWWWAVNMFFDHGINKCHFQWWMVSYILIYVIFICKAFNIFHYYQSIVHVLYNNNICHPFSVWHNVIDHIPANIFVYPSWKLLTFSPSVSKLSSLTLALWLIFG